MKKFLPYIIYSTIGLALFVGSYVGIAAMSGAPLHEIAGISMFVDTPEEGEEEELEQEPDFDDEIAGGEELEAPDGKELLEANAGLLGAYMISSPYSGPELRELVNDLKGQQREHTLERERLRLRDLELDEWEHSLLEKQGELAELRTKLEDLENTIDLRMEELLRDELSREQEELRGWKDLAKLYEGGTAEVNAMMLAEESPEDAALILRELDEKVAGEILRVMQPATTRKKYMDAYRMSPPSGDPE